MGKHQMAKSVLHCNDNQDIAPLIEEDSSFRPRKFPADRKIARQQWWATEV
jgi:hypothetical protein